ncbi:MAG: hypothetical protein ABR587_02365, partial [Candidatus Binatia bacterium]
AAVSAPRTGDANPRTAAANAPATVPGRAATPLHVYDGADAAEVLANLDAGRETDWTTAERKPHDARLVLVAGNEDILAQRTLRARAHLLKQAPAGEGVHFRSAAVTG